MANPFALLDTVGDDDSEFTALASSSSASSKALASPSSVSKEQRPSLSRGAPLPQLQSGKQRGRGIPGGQQNSLLKIQQGEHSQDGRSGYRRYDGQGYQKRGARNAHPQYNSQTEGNHRYDRRANNYQQPNIGSNGYRRKSIPEQGGADNLKPSKRDSSAGHNGSDQAEWQVMRRRRRVNVSEDNQHESKLVEGGSGSSQEKSTGHKFYRENSNEGRNQRFNASWERRSNRGGNLSRASRSFARQGNAEVNTPKSDAPGDSEVPLVHTGESANKERKEIVVETKEAEPRRSQEVPPALMSSAKEMEDREEYEKQLLEKTKAREAWLAEERKKMTLREYEKQLLEKRKALEALRAEERTVTMDKEFEAMQLVGRKKEEGVGLENSNYQKEKVKNQHNLEKDEKLRKIPMSIEEFKRKYRSRGNARDHGWGRRGQPESEKKGAAPENDKEGHSRPVRENPAPDIEDSNLFPGLGSL